ncbi:MAG TPA: phosphoenolpyruvate--protein phosphotransferase [Acidobacteriota bacterium]|nr:phosphoenolpyruvate--protein phosphotransferase [Acidobacteriota bacterium]
MRRAPDQEIHQREYQPDSNEAGSFKLSGIPLSPGVVVGTAYQVEPFKPAFYRLTITADEVDKELQRFKDAIAQSRVQLMNIRQRLEELVGKEHAYIADVHLLILEDQRFLAQTEEKIVRRLCSPERAIRETAEEWLSVFRSLEDPFFQERGSEIQDVEHRLLANLGEENLKNSALPEALILVAPEVSLSVLANYHLDRIKGLVVTRGGSTSHVTIIARSYQIPMVSGVEGVERIHTGDTILVDANDGIVYRNPGPRVIRQYRLGADRQQRLLFDWEDFDQTPCGTADGRRIHLYINTENESEVAAGLRQGAEGVGLFRPEFMFVKNPASPRLPGMTSLLSEDAQYDTYRSLGAAAGGRPVLLRTLDTGEGTLASCQPAASEKSSLGLRGIRLSLKHPEVFRVQLRAVLRASLSGNLKLVFPMVSSVDEVIAAREILHEVQTELECEGIKFDHPIEVGVMLEVPAAIFTLEGLMQYADFAAVGTNDLIQYTLAAGRADTLVSDLFNPLHPAVLTSLKKVVDVCGGLGKRSYICGEVASHPLYVYVLIGLGFQHLSLHLRGLAPIKKAIARMNYEKARNDAEHLLTLQTVAAVTRFVENDLQPRIME